MRFRMNRESERPSDVDFSESEGLSFVAGPGFEPATSGSQAPLRQSLCWFAQSLADLVFSCVHPISADHRESGIASDFCRANVSSFRPRASAASPGPTEASPLIFGVMITRNRVSASPALKSPRWHSRLDHGELRAIEQPPPIRHLAPDMALSVGDVDRFRIRRSSRTRGTRLARTLLALAHDSTGAEHIFSRPVFWGWLERTHGLISILRHSKPPREREAVVVDGVDDVVYAPMAVRVWMSGQVKTSRSPSPTRLM